MRTPQAGRVWEAFGEDPFYSGVCASQTTKGIQDAGVILLNILLKMIKKHIDKLVHLI